MRANPAWERVVEGGREARGDCAFTHSCGRLESALLSHHTLVMVTKDVHACIRAHRREVVVMRIIAYLIFHIGNVPNHVIHLHCNDI